MFGKNKFYKWYETGLKHGWCSRVVCERHEGLPWTEEEAADWSDGSDFCVFAVRVYGRKETLR